MQPKNYVWLLLVAVLFFAGCTKLAAYTNKTNVSPSDQEAISCLSGCTTDYSPVCGVNNKTYWNSCAARCAGITVARQGDCKPVVKTCNDSDSGKDANVKGTTTSDGQSNSDKCMNTTTVLEYYCSGSDMTSKTIDCGDGYECGNGACVVAAAAQACNDSDNGKDIFAKGTVKADGKSYADACNDSGTVNEYYCADDNVSSKLMDCPDGYECTSGKCVKVEAGCEDSDNGQNLTRRGTVTVITENGTKNYTDDCYSEATVIEYICNGTSMAMKKVACPDGTACTVGACTQSECEDTDGGINETEKGTVTLGSDESTDKCKNDTAVTEYYCSSGDIRSKTVACDDGYSCTSGACVADCTETDDVDDIYDKGVTTQGEDEYTDKCKTNTTLTEYYCDDNDLKSKTATCPSDYACIDGECAYKCTETDSGKDYYEPGITTKGSDSFDDTCVNATALTEYYCYNNFVKNITYTCTGNYTCGSGACIQ